MRNLCDGLDYLREYDRAMGLEWTYDKMEEKGMSRDQKYLAVNTMAEIGGAFVKSLATCWMLADEDNRAKLADGFAADFAKYLKMAVDREPQHAD